MSAREVGNAPQVADDSPTTTTMPPGSGGSWSKLKDDAAAIELTARQTATTDDAGVNGDKKGPNALGHEGSRDGPGGSTAEYKVYRRRWFGFVELTLLNIIVSWDWLTFAPVANHSATFFQTSEATINWLSIGFMFAFVVIAPVVIYVLHWGPRPSIMASSVLVLLGNWIRYGGTRAGGMSGFGAVMFGQILTGLAQPFVLAAPTRYSDLWFTNRGRVAATALMSLANPFGAALGQLIIPFWVAGPADIPNMVLWISIIATAFAVPGFFIPAAPPTPVAPSGETTKLEIMQSLRILAGSVEFWMLFVPFSIYVGFFNSISSLLVQMMAPHGFSNDEAGIAGAVLIVVGLVASAIVSPIIDRTKKFILSIKILVPLIALSYLAFIWMPGTKEGGGIAGPYVVLAVLGATSFSLLPVVIELLVEFTHPVSPEITSVLAWAGGQILGACFILISDALKAGDDASPPRNMTNALIFQAVLALAIVPLPMCLGLFGRSDKVSLRRVVSDQQVLEGRRPE